MPPRVRRITRRLAAVGPGFVDTFLRDNKVLPPVLALLALLVLAWVVAGAYVGGPNGEQVANQANVSQSQDAPGADPAAPEIENPDVDSYAAYRNKDPFRQLLAPADSTSSQPAEETTGQPAAGAGSSDATDDTGGGGSTSDGRPRNTGGAASDTDNDGLTDRREATLAQDPQNPDTDGDGIQDGADDADGDGQPDGRASGVGGDAGSGTGAEGPPASASPPASDDASDGAGGGRGDGPGGGRGDGPGGGRGGRGDDLLDSGGSLYAP